jgi:hypothetical protein
MDGRRRWVRHIKPDLVLADNFSPDRTVVVLIDFSVVADQDIGRAEIEKRVKYHPLCEVIRRKLGKGNHKVYFVSIIFGRSGIPPTDWNKICAAIKVVETPSALCRRIMTGILGDAKMMFQVWRKKNGLM